MFAVELIWSRCPDGVELVEFGTMGEAAKAGIELSGHEKLASFYRFRTSRREERRYELSKLEDPIIVRAANALAFSDWDFSIFDDDPVLARHFKYRGIKKPVGFQSLEPSAFFSRYGFPLGDKDVSLDEAITFFAFAQHTLRVITDYDDVNGAVEFVNAALFLRGRSDDLERLSEGEDFSKIVASRLFATVPQLDLAGEGGRPRMTLQAQTLSAFIMHEAALIVIHGASLKACENCGKLFLTGPATGRRSTAQYCSDRCRVAAMRARQAGTREA